MEERSIFLKGEDLIRLRNINEETISRYEKKSLNGNQVERTGKKEKVDPKSRIKKYIAIFTIAAIAAGIPEAAIINNFAEKQHNKEVINMVTDEVQERILKPHEISIFDNGKHQKGYDTSSVIEKLENSSNFDTDLYIVLNEVGSDDKQAIFDHFNYQDFSDYLSKKGFSSKDEYEETMKERIILQGNIQQQNQQLSAFDNSHNFESDSSKGAK